MAGKTKPHDIKSILLCITSVMMSLGLAGGTAFRASGGTLQQATINSLIDCNVGPLNLRVGKSPSYSFCFLFLFSLIAHFCVNLTMALSVFSVIRSMALSAPELPYGTPRSTFTPYAQFIHRRSLA